MATKTPEKMNFKCKITITTFAIAMITKYKKNLSEYSRSKPIPGTWINETTGEIITLLLKNFDSSLMLDNIHKASKHKIVEATIQFVKASIR